MINELELIETPNNWIAVFSGKTGMGQTVKQEEGHNIEGANENERILNALNIWGVVKEETKITIN